MTIADEFRRSLEVGLTELAANEWAVTEAREQVVCDVTPSEAFENIIDVLSLAGEQTDPYAHVATIALWRKGAGRLREWSLGHDAYLRLDTLAGCASNTNDDQT